MPIQSKKSTPLTKHFPTSMVSCKQLGKDGHYNCMALLPGKKHEGFVEMKLKDIADKHGNTVLFDDVTINDATIVAKEFQFHRATNINCVADFLGKTLRCK